MTDQPDEILSSAGLQDDVAALRMTAGRILGGDDVQALTQIVIALLEVLRVYAQRETDEACACLDDDEFDDEPAELPPAERVN